MDSGLLTVQNESTSADQKLKGSSSGELLTKNSDSAAASSVLGTTTGAAVVTDADGTIQRYLRGLVKILVQTVLADATANPTIPWIGSFLSLFNGTTWDRSRNNHEVTVLASAARASNTNSADIVNYNARGVVITIDITVLASATLTFTVTYKDSLTGKYQTILASAALAGTGTTTLTIYPGTTIAANLVANSPLPRIWRVQVVQSVGGTDTYSVSANYIN